MRPNDLQKGLKTRVFGRPLYWFERTTSTNDVALELAKAGAAEGTVVAADVQTKGRGRQGRRWFQGEGKGLAFSIVLRPKLKPGELPEITLAAALGVAKAMEGLGLRPRIKWPNDVLLGGKKACGILTELGGSREGMAPVILGVGVNVDQASRDLPTELRRTAVSLRMAKGRRIGRERFFRNLLLQLEKSYQWILERRFDRILVEWKKRSATLGRQVKVTQAGHGFYGQAVGLDEKGALLVRTDHGPVERVVSGDVQILKF